MEEIKLVPINFWDDYRDDLDGGLIDDTFCYVDSKEVSLEDQKKHLTFILNYILERAHLVRKGLKMKIKLYDSSITHPSIPREWQIKRWEIIFGGLTHELRERIIEELNNGELPFHVYSES